MKILLTGGSGDLGQVLAPKLAKLGHEPVILDIMPPLTQGVDFIQQSLLEPATLAQALQGMDAVVHIAAWHGIHEVKGIKSEAEFWDLNVNGTFNLLQACIQEKIPRIVHISSTSVRKSSGFYGLTKRIAESTVDHFHHAQGLQTMTLRPRAFIPHWNRSVYDDYLAWARRFWPGAVHIDDVCQAVIGSLHLLESDPPGESLKLTIDRAQDFPAAALTGWDTQGPGDTFRQHFPLYVSLAEEQGLDTTVRPHSEDIEPAREVIDYQPRFGLQEMLQELSQQALR